MIKVLRNCKVKYELRTTVKLPLVKIICLVVQKPFFITRTNFPFIGSTADTSLVTPADDIDFLLDVTHPPSIPPCPQPI